MQKRLNKQAQEYIGQMAFAVRCLWEKACDHDQIPHDTKFAVFSDDNPFMPFYNRALTQYQDARAQYAAGGYVGLTIKKRG
jgi:hypothetical protein